MNTEAVNNGTETTAPKRKGAPPAFSLYLKDKESKANIPLGAIWENRFDDGNIGYAVGLAQTYIRDPRNPKYDADKEAFLLQMERFYDGELYLNMNHTAARGGGSRSSARNALREGEPRNGGGEGKGDGWMTRIIKAAFNLK